MRAVLAPFFAGCFAIGESSSEPSATSTETQFASDEGTAIADTGYLALTPRKISGYSLVQFTIDGHNTMLRFSIPNDWTLEAGSLKFSRPSILILGNSFISTSEIGSILQSMCDAGGKQVDVTAVSRGYATVGSYAEAADYLRYIENGQYGIVFMCGFYGSGDADKPDCFVDVCISSGTPLVIFPAHNENQNVVSIATLRNARNAYFLDWKGEISNLIKAKVVTAGDMCINDQHKHSTPLAGFVGAHMIYRTLFGSIPPEINTYSMSTFRAEYVLGDYVKTGKISGVDTVPIYRIAS